MIMKNVCSELYWVQQQLKQAETRSQSGIGDFKSSYSTKMTEPTAAQ